MHVFYTDHEVIARCIACILGFAIIRGRTVRRVIDFSAGDGRFCAMLKQALGGVCDMEQYDLDPRDASVTQCNWFDVSPEIVDVVGFNPPFGYQGALARQFMEHATRARPWLMVILHPYARRRLFPHNYAPVHQIPLDADSFYDPETLQRMPVRNCKVTFLLHTPGYIHAEDALVEFAPERLPLPAGVMRVDRTRPWHEMERVLAVRRVGENAARHVLCWRGSGGTLLLEDGRTHVDVDARGGLPDGMALATEAFVSFGIPSMPTPTLAEQLWTLMQSEFQGYTHGLIRSVRARDVETCVARVLSQ